MQLNIEKKLNTKEIKILRWIDYLLFIYTIVTLITFPVIWLITVIPYLIYLYFRFPIIKSFKLNHKTKHILSYIVGTGVFIFIIITISIIKIPVIDAYEKQFTKPPPQYKYFMELIDDKKDIKDEKIDSDIASDKNREVQKDASGGELEDFSVSFLSNTVNWNKGNEGQNSTNDKSETNNETNDLKNVKKEDYKALVEDFEQKVKNNQLDKKSVPQNSKLNSNNITEKPLSELALNRKPTDTQIDEELKPNSLNIGDYNVADANLTNAQLGDKTLIAAGHNINDKDLKDMGFGDRPIQRSGNLDGNFDPEKALKDLNKEGQKNIRKKKNYHGTINYENNKMKFDPGSVKIKNHRIEKYIYNGFSKLTSLWFYKFAPLEQIGQFKTLNPGSVVVEFNLDENGNLIYYKIVKPDKQPSLNEAVKNALHNFEGFGKIPSKDMVINKMVLELKVYPPQRPDGMYIIYIGSGKLEYDFDVIEEESENDE